LLAAGTLALSAAAGVHAQDASPYAIDIPPWFAETFLDFREDIADAAKDGKRLMVYLGQDGCPYCRQLMVTNFSQRQIVDKMHRHFVAIALNIWGDREVTWLDGRTMSEKALARALDVQFTPTLLFSTRRQHRRAAQRILSAAQFEAVLDTFREERKARDAGCLRGRRTPRRPMRRSPTSPSSRNLRTSSRGRPMASRSPSSSKHRIAPRATDAPRPVPPPRRQRAARPLRRRPFRPRGGTELTTPNGARVKADAWARDLHIAYTPTVVLFDPSGREVLRLDAYLRAFHFASALDYVASGSYRPSRRSSASCRPARNGCAKAARASISGNRARARRDVCSVALAHSERSNPMPQRPIKTVIEKQKILTAPANTTVHDAAQQMVKRNVGAIMVVDATGRLAGIFTERDALYRVMAKGRDAKTLTLAQVMTTHPQTIEADKPVGLALLMMYDGGFRHVPVVSHGRPVGMISARDALGPGCRSSNWSSSAGSGSAKCLAEASLCRSRSVRAARCRGGIARSSKLLRLGFAGRARTFWRSPYRVTLRSLLTS
jgi:thioredoxin-related protein/CBS domain-containing protein